MPTDPRLAQYVKAELCKGYGRDQITLALAKSGYRPADIDATFRQLSDDLQGAEALAQSIARTGTTREQARAQLAQAGYTGAATRRAVNNVYGAPSDGHLSTAMFAIIALAIGAGGMWLYLGIADNGAPAPAGGTIALSPSEVIAQVLEVVRAQGTDAGIAACKQRLSGRDRDLCILDVAILPDVADMALCDQVADVQYADACYLNFLGDERNVDAACAKVRLAENRDTCEAIIRLRPATPSV